MAKNKSVNQLIARAIPGDKSTNNWFAEDIKFDTPKLYGFSIVVHFGLSAGSSGIIEYTIDGGHKYNTFINTGIVNDKAGLEREITMSGGNNGDITNYADNGGTEIVCTAINHKLQVGDIVEITENPDYNGRHEITEVTDDTFTFIGFFSTNNPIGKFDSADRFNIRSQTSVSIDHCRVDIV